MWNPEKADNPVSQSLTINTADVGVKGLDPVVSFFLPPFNHEFCKGGTLSVRVPLDRALSKANDYVRSCPLPDPQYQRLTMQLIKAKEG